jgi:multidrug resistance efflux pump
MKTMVRTIATLLILAAGCAGGYELWDYYMYSPWTRDARVRADVVAIAPDVAGFVSTILVKDNQFVREGDVLFVLDQERYKLALATADANVAAQKANMTMRQSEANRRIKLTNLSISDEAKEDAQHVAASATAAYEQAMADRRTAALNLERTVIRAPVNGYVTNLSLVVGQYIGIGGKAMALIDSDSYRVEGYFEETKIPLVKVGEPAKIYLMSGAPALAGRVDSVSRGITDRDNTDGPELLANVTPTFEWVRLAQRIPVRIRIDSVPAGVQISGGMTCTVVMSAPRREWAIASMIRGAFSGRAFAADAR